MTRLSDNIEKLRDASRNRLESSKGKLAEVRVTAVDKASEGSVIAREKMSDGKARAAELLGQGKDVALQRKAAATDATKRAVATASSKSEETIQKNPLAMLAGGLAIGVAIAAFLPRTKAESKIVGGAGKALNAAAIAAMFAAKEAGKDQISELGSEFERYAQPVQGFAWQISGYC